MAEKINKKVFSWALYDWGNSAFSTTVMAGFFPIFFKSYWSQGTEAVVSTARLGSVISISSFLIAVLSPTLGVMADLRGSKKTFCLFFTMIGILSCAGLAIIPAGSWQAAAVVFGLGMMAFNAASVFYDSLLPSVAVGSRMDHVSSLGYSLGYLGGGILFLVNVLMTLYPTTFGLRDSIQAVQVSFLSVAFWWFVFTIPLAKNVPEPAVLGSTPGIWQLSRASFRTLASTVRELVKEKNILLFVVAYWLYIDGVYTVMTMAVDFGMALGFESKDLIVALLLTQFIGFPCAYYFGMVTKRFGTRKPILLCIVIYAITLVLATMMTQAWHFFALATVIGMVQGGVQSLSRSMFGRMIPAKLSGEYFGIFNLVGRFASILGPVLVGFGALLTGSSRLGMLGILVLFLVGGFLLYKVKEPTGNN